MLVDTLLFRGLYPVLGAAGVWRWWRARRGADVCTAATYHGVLPEGYRTDPVLDRYMVTRESFLAQLRLLKQRYAPITPSHFLAWLRGETEIPPRAVLLTCDDGTRTHLSVMTPLLKEEGMACWFFVSGASDSDAPGIMWYEEVYLLLARARAADGPFRFGDVRFDRVPRAGRERERLWNALIEQFARMTSGARRAAIDDMARRLDVPEDWLPELLARQPERDRFLALNRDEVAELERAGMTVGAHTLTHPALAQLPEEEARSEIVGSKKMVEEAWNVADPAIAYPFGHPAAAGEREFRLSREAGCACGFMNEAGFITPGVARMDCPRVHVDLRMEPAEFEARVSGAHEVIRQTIVSPLQRAGLRRGATR